MIVEGWEGRTGGEEDLEAPERRFFFLIMRDGNLAEEVKRRKEKVKPE